MCNYINISWLLLECIFYIAAITQEIDLTGLWKDGQISTGHIRFFIRMLQKAKLLPGCWWGRNRPYRASYADCRLSTRGRSLGNAGTFSYTQGESKRWNPHFRRIRLFSLRTHTRLWVERSKLKKKKIYPHILKHT